MELVAVAERLVAELEGLRFGPPVCYVYNPLDYAAEAHEAYLRRFGRAPKEVVLVGMNPGPWGMAQTGVPFGEVAAVRDWLGLRVRVGRPSAEHPKRPVLGLESSRSEVSGRRFWGWARALSGTPERFFARCFVHNYCPLMVLEASGRNRTPDRLPAAERRPLLAACDQALRRTVELLRPALVVGVGAFATSRAEAALEGVRIGRIPHPSPASPAANRGWAAQASAALAALGVALPVGGNEGSAG